MRGDHDPGGGGETKSPKERDDLFFCAHLSRAKNPAFLKTPIIIYKIPIWTLSSKNEGNSPFIPAIQILDKIIF
jgi:hypothetical protein